MRNPIFNWVFYGHLWIALAAAALGWQSTYLSYYDPSIRLEHGVLFFATFGVYTLHRLFSYTRALGQPTARRYAIVSRWTRLSALLGIASLLIACTLATKLPIANFWPVAIALPFTAFYLVPLYPGGPRLRDLPYLKVVWVALAWTLMTDAFPVQYAGNALFEVIIRFCFTLSIALLFDTRDVELDRRQGVRTLAADRPMLNRIVAIALLVLCAVGSLLASEGSRGIPLATAYGLGIAVAAFTRAGRGENYYATVVNGLLLLPPLLLFLLSR